MTSMTREEILARPAAAQAAIKEIAEAAKSPLPDAPFPPDDLVTLPGGLMHKGTLIRQAVVRELTGEDEEALAKAIQSPSTFHFIDTLLRRGIDRLGDLDYEESARLLPELLTGDRDEIILGIRTATYGDTVEVFRWTCPSCGSTVDKIGFSLKDDVKRTKLRDPADVVFDVKLRKGASARVRLATGAVALAANEDPGLLTPQRDDIMLSKCIETYTDARGQAHLIAGFPSMVRRMSAPDRRTVLLELSKRQPGPRYNEVTFNHDGCGEKVTLALGIIDLFRDLIAGLI
jgi:hypothetical protein